MNLTSSDDLCDPSPGLYVQIVGTGLFLLTWPLVVADIRYFPLGRPAAALAGATMMVIFNIMTQDRVYEIEGQKDSLQTLFLLVGTMILAYYFDREGLLRILALSIFGKKKVPMRHILWKVCVLSAVMAAFLTNDATSLALSPLLLVEFKQQHRPLREVLPLALSIATSANIGSAVTIFGNPQNAFISSSADISLLDFLKAELPAAVLALTINTTLLYLLFFRTLFRDPLPTEEEEREERERRKDMYDAGIELQTSAGSIAEEREVVIMQQDQSSNPGLTSQISQEREVMYGGELRVTPSRSYHSLRQSQSAHSLHQRKSFSPKPVKITLPEIRVTHPPTAGEQGVTEIVQETDTVVLESYPTHITPLQERGRRELLFIAWLVFIAVLIVVLLALPPSPSVGAEFNLGVVPLGAGLLTMLVDSLLNRKYAFEAMAGIDWTVVLLLMGLFAWLGGFQNTCIPHTVFQKLAPHMNLHTVGGLLLFTVFVIVGASVFGTLPFTILIVDKLPLLCGAEVCEGALPGLLLAWVATLSGNMTLIGSVTNLIVAEKARATAGYRLTFFQYARFGCISTLLATFSGLPVVYILGRYTQAV